MQRTITLTTINLKDSLLNPSVDVVEVKINFGFFYHLVSADINLINEWI